MELRFNSLEEVANFARTCLGLSDQTTAPTAPVTPVAPTAPVTPVVPVTPAAPVTPVVPVTPAAPVAPVAPTQLPTYTIEQIAVAAVQLKDAGRLGEFQQLLAKFGVAALTQLAPERLPELAAELQKMGVRL